MTVQLLQKSEKITNQKSKYYWYQTPVVLSPAQAIANHQQFRSSHKILWEYDLGRFKLDSKFGYRPAGGDQV